MNVLMVLDHEFPPDVRVENEATALIEAGHVVYMACYTQKNKPLFEEYKGIKIHRTPIDSFTYKSSVAALTFPHYFNFWYRFIRRIVVENNIKAIHIHDLPLAKVGKRVKDKHGVKLVIDLHENWPALLRVSTHTNTFLGKLLSPNWMWERYEKKTLRFADRIIVVVDEARERLANIGINPNSVFVVSNTLNEESFVVPELTPDSNFFTLYYAGGINYHRGIQNVIKALAKVTKTIPQIRFRIAGSGSYKPAIEKLAHELNVSNNVEFLGHLSLSDVAKNLALADAAIIPHLKTDHTDSTIPHKLFQYMYACKPIVTSNCKPLERITNQTHAGVVYRWDSVDDLAEKLLSLATKSIEIPPARKWVEEKYNWKVDSMILTKMYDNLASSDAPGY